MLAGSANNYLANNYLANNYLANNYLGDKYIGQKLNASPRRQRAARTRSRDSVGMFEALRVWAVDSEKSTWCDFEDVVKGAFLT